MFMNPTALLLTLALALLAPIFASPIDTSPSSTSSISPMPRALTDTLDRRGGADHGLRHGGEPRGGHHSSPCGDLGGKIYFAPRADVTITILSGTMTRCHGAKRRYTVRKADMGGVRWHTQNSVVDTDCKFDGTFTDPEGTATFDFLDSDDYLQPGYTGVSNGVRIVCNI